jgi:hypothetical protein
MCPLREFPVGRELVVKNLALLLSTESLQNKDSQWPECIYKAGTKAEGKALSIMEGKPARHGSVSRPDPML